MELPPAAALLATLRDRFPRARIVDVDVGVGVGEDAGFAVVTIQCGMPAYLIGRDGAQIEELERELTAQGGPTRIALVELRQHELVPRLVVDDLLMRVRSQLEGDGFDVERTRGVAQLRVDAALRLGAIGAHVEVSGGIDVSAGVVDGGEACEDGVDVDGRIVRCRVVIRRPPSGS